MRKEIFPFLIISVFCLMLSEFALSQTQQKVISEDDLIKSWKLERDMIHDRSPDYIPTQTLKLNFYSNHTCNGIIVGTDTSLSGSWKLEERHLTIKYKTKNGEEKQEEYNIVELTQIKMVLSHHKYFGSARRTFISIK
jgi:hypothetical protein